MFKPIVSRKDYTTLMGVADDAMYLRELRTNYASRDFEVIAGVFTDPREAPEYPDFGFAHIYPRTWSAEDVRMSLFAWLASTKAAYDARRFPC